MAGPGRAIRCPRCMEAHDYGSLVARWKRLCARAGFRMRAIARADGHSVYGITTAPRNAPPGEYISAGIHGDEPAGGWGLLGWAERNWRRLKLREWVLLPCLNPWGLVANSRYDQKGRDLNRSFHLGQVPVIRGWRKFVGKRRFPGTAVMMHEDYDGDGIYAYYVGSDRKAGKRGIAAAGRVIRPSSSPRIDRRWRQDGGIVRLPRRRRVPQGVEAGYILSHHASSISTMETPSELSFDLRVRAHIAYLVSITRPLL